MKVQFKIDPVELAQAAHIEGLLMSKGITFTASVVTEGKPALKTRKRRKANNAGFTESECKAIRAELQKDNARSAPEIADSAGLIRMGLKRKYELVAQERARLGLPNLTKLLMQERHRRGRELLNGKGGYIGQWSA